MSNTHVTVGSRELSLSGGEKVVVSLGMPVPLKGGEGDYRCAYQIAGLREETKGRVIGSDALQALQLALVKIGAILYTSAEWQDDLLSWNGDKDLGFPLPESIRDLRG